MADDIPSNSVVVVEPIPVQVAMAPPITEHRNPPAVLQLPQIPITPMRINNYSADPNSRSLHSGTNETMAAGGKATPKKITGTAARTCRSSDESAKKQGSSNVGEAYRSRKSPDAVTQPTQSTPGTQSSKGFRNYKEMLECVKKLHGSADKLHERSCQLHHEFASIIIKAAFLFTPEEMEILHQTDERLGISKLQDPDQVHFMAEDVGNRYGEMIEKLDEYHRHQQSLNELEEPMQTADESS